MAGTVHGSLVQQFASMKPTEFGPAIEPKWQLGGRLIKQVQTALGDGTPYRREAPALPRDPYALVGHVLGKAETARQNANMEL